MEILKFNIFNFLNESKQTTVPPVPLCPTFPYNKAVDGDFVKACARTACKFGIIS